MFRDIMKYLPDLVTPIREWADELTSQNGLMRWIDEDGSGPIKLFMPTMIIGFIVFTILFWIIYGLISIIPPMLMWIAFALGCSFGVYNLTYMSYKAYQESQEDTEEPVVNGVVGSVDGSN